MKENKIFSFSKSKITSTVLLGIIGAFLMFILAFATMDATADTPGIFFWQCLLGVLKVIFSGVWGVLKMSNQLLGTSTSLLGSPITHSILESGLGIFVFVVAILVNFIWDYFLVCLVFYIFKYIFKKFRSKKESLPNHSD